MISYIYKDKPACNIMNINNLAFTLAEVLIVLGIIGIIAEMTIPTLMNNVQESVYKSSYKKAFSVAKQAWTQAVTDDTMTSRAGWGDATAKLANFKAFKAYFRVIKDCSSNNNNECWDSSGEKYFVTLPDNPTLAFIDASGMAWSLCSNYEGNGSELLVDVNGLKKPNKYGQDRFVFKTATDDGVISTAGIPTRIVLNPDYNYDEDLCPSGAKHPCYYTSWILGGG